MQDCMLKGSLSVQSMGLAVFDPLLADFDAVIVLQREALPSGDQALLQPSEPDGKQRRLLPQLLTLAGFPASSDEPILPPKSARVNLRSIPKRGYLVSFGSAWALTPLHPVL